MACVEVVVKELVPNLIFKNGHLAVKGCGAHKLEFRSSLAGSNTVTCLYQHNYTHV